LWFAGSTEWKTKSYGGGRETPLKEDKNGISHCLPVCD
jgi:hypothetical protein